MELNLREEISVWSVKFKVSTRIMVDKIEWSFAISILDHLTKKNLKNIRGK